MAFLRALGLPTEIVTSIVEWSGAEAIATLASLSKADKECMDVVAPMTRFARVYRLHNPPVLTTNMAHTRSVVLRDLSSDTSLSPALERMPGLRHISVVCSGGDVAVPPSMPWPSSTTTIRFGGDGDAEEVMQSLSIAEQVWPESTTSLHIKAAETVSLANFPPRLRQFTLNCSSIVGSLVGSLPALPASTVTASLTALYSTIHVRELLHQVRRPLSLVLSSARLVGLPDVWPPTLTKLVLKVIVAF